MLRIGLFTEVYHPVVNGVVTAVDTLRTCLTELGHEVTVFTPRHPEARYDAGVVRIPSLPLPTQSDYRLTVPVLRRSEIAHRVAQLDVLHLHSPFVTGWMGLRYARRYGHPTIYTYHTQLEAYAHYVPFEARATRYAASELTRRFANAVAAVIVPTVAMEHRLRDLGVEGRVEVLPSGIDVEFFARGRRCEDLRERMGAGSADRLYLAVGRLALEKNLDIVVEALARVGSPNVRLAFVGDGPEREALEALVRERALTDRVRFLGSLPRESLPDFYASADAFLFPSLTETQGLVQVEALAAGLPVLAADSPQNRDVLGGCARLLAPDAHSFARAMEVASPAEATREEMLVVARRFDARTLAVRCIELYQEAIVRLATPA
ncbi:MAG: glycosyltransferase [Candidatus Eremiobacteraeota bacterium]|nr:glycosyltransferase [Candidatus Eremiobacteraeota bacterium]